MAPTTWKKGTKIQFWFLDLSITMLVLIIGVSSITGLDFDPRGTLVASIDEDGVCVVSNIDTNNSSYHKKMGVYFGNSINICFFCCHSTCILII